MWTADKIAYRNQENFVRAYLGGSLLWDKDGNNKIYYTSRNNVIVNPTTNIFGGCEIVSNTNINGQGIIEFNGIITVIPTYAFNWTDLQTVIIPETVTTLESYCFGNCRLTGIHIPAMVTTINNAFPFTNDLYTITVDPNNTVYDSRDNCNCLIESASDTLIWAGPNSFIPNTIKILGGWCFGSKHITNITIPNSVVRIESGAFSNNNNLTTITIPSSVTFIGGACFGYTGLQELIMNPVIPPDLEYTGRNIFNGNETFPTIRVPAGSVEAYKTDQKWSYYASSIVAQ